MGTSNSIFNFNGTVGKVTHVKSKTYGSHTRSARGSVNPCGVNEAYQKSGANLVKANIAARLVKGSIDKYRNGFNGGQFWQKLVSVFKAQVRDGVGFNVNDLRGTEIHDDYKISTRFSSNLYCAVKRRDNLLHVCIYSVKHPHFKHIGADGYRLSLIVVSPDFKADTAWDTMLSLPPVSFKDTYKPAEFVVDLAEHDGPFLLCLKLEACAKGIVLKGNQYGGMRIIGNAPQKVLSGNFPTFDHPMADELELPVEKHIPFPGKAEIIPFLETVLSEENKHRVCSSLAEYHREDGGLPTVTGFEITDATFDLKTSKGTVGFKYRLERYWACAAENTESADSQKWEFELDTKKSILILKPEQKQVRDTFEEF